METERIIMLCLDVLILICIVAGFAVLRKFLKTHSGENAEDNQKALKKIIFFTGISIAALSFAVMIIGITVKLFN